MDEGQMPNATAAWRRGGNYAAEDAVVLIPVRPQGTRRYKRLSAPVCGGDRNLYVLFVATSLKRTSAPVIVSVGAPPSSLDGRRCR